MPPGTCRAEAQSFARKMETGWSGLQDPEWRIGMMDGGTGQGVADAKGGSLQRPLAPPPVTGNRGDDEIDLGELIAVIWKGKLRVVLLAALGLASAAFVYANSERVFQADALLQLEEKSAALSLPSSLAALTDKDPRSVTEIEIIRSRMVLGQAVAALNLDWRIEPALAPLAGRMLSVYRLPLVDTLLPRRFARPGESITLTELVVPPNWLGRPLELTVLGEDRFRLVMPDGSTATGTVGVAVSRPEVGFSLTVAAIEAEEGREYTLRQINEAAAIEALRQRLTVSERGRASGILEARLTGPNRGENTRALDAVILSYQRQNIARSAAEAESSLSFIREQIPAAERTLREAEAALNAFRLEQASIDLSLETNNLLSQISRLEAQLFEMQRREDELAQRYTPSHPSYRLLLDERTRLEELLSSLRDQVAELPETQRQIVNLTRDVELAQRLHLELLTRAQQVEVLRASTIGSVRIIDPAVAGQRPIAPRLQLLLALGLLLGAMLGVFWVLIRNWLRKGVQDARELEALGLPVSATINYSRDADTRGSRKGELQILALESPADVTVEAFRSLRTSLHFGMLDARTPSIAVTSTHPEAGKSFLSANLAVVAAQAGQRVLLVDADLRRGQLRRYFGLPRNHPGLAEVLAGDLPAADAVFRTPVEGLDVLTTGRYPPNPSELLMRSSLTDLIDWAAGRYDLTILDTPPVLAVTDPVIVGRSVGASILIARHDVTLTAEVDAAIKAFTSSGQRLAGAILNGFDPRKAKAGYSYGYGYGYRYEYRQRTE